MSKGMVGSRWIWCEKWICSGRQHPVLDNFRFFFITRSNSKILSPVYQELGSDIIAVDLVGIVVGLRLYPGEACLSLDVTSV